MHKPMMTIIELGPLAYTVIAYSPLHNNIPFWDSLPTNLVFQDFKRELAICSRCCGFSFNKSLSNLLEYIPLFC